MRKISGLDFKKVRKDIYICFRLKKKFGRIKV